MLLARESANSGLLFDLSKLEAEIKELSAKSEDPNFWNDRNLALETINRLNTIRSTYEAYISISTTYSDLVELLELEDESIYESICESFDELKKNVEEFEVDRLFSGEFDNLNAILEIHPGAGGTEAQDWADMLYRMYVLYAENHKRAYH